MHSEGMITKEMLEELECVLENFQITDGMSPLASLKIQSETNANSCAIAGGSLRLRDCLDEYMPSRPDGVDIFNRPIEWLFDILTSAGVSEGV